MMRIFSSIICFYLLVNLTPVVYADNEETEPVETPAYLVIRDVSFKKENGKSEIVYIRLNRFSWPAITHYLESDQPMLEIEWGQAEMPPKNFSAIPINGQWVKGIRSQYNTDSHRLKIFMDLHPSKGYQVSQGLDQKENILSIKIETEIRSKEETKK